ncbi:hypothetical protein RRF57_004808 [Xylaria bambusicola]|uniref:Uncharacterized protein n=1 Tax=Xylaria bambusicola TaxID=326684 RepID=A0AAN7Z755_9PEZI
MQNFHYVSSTKRNEIEEVFGIKHIPCEPKPPCNYDPFDGTRQTIPSRFHELLNNALRDRLQIRITGNQTLFCAPGYTLQNTTKYFEVNRDFWVLLEPQHRPDGSEHNFLFHAHHFVVTFTTDKPDPSEWDALAIQLQDDVLAPLSMKDVSMEFRSYDSQNGFRAIYPPTIYEYDLRYIFASELPTDPIRRDSEDHEAQHDHDELFRLNSKMMYSKLPEITIPEPEDLEPGNQYLEGTEESPASSRKGKEKAPMSSPAVSQLSRHNWKDVTGV